MVDVLRERSNAEKNLKEGGFLDVAHWKKDDAFQNALKKISEIMYNFEYKKRQPYCKNCAVKAVKQEIARLNENVIKKMENKESSVNLEFNIDYDKFGGADKFEKVEGKLFIGVGIRQTKYITIK